MLAKQVKHNKNRTAKKHMMIYFTYNSEKVFMKRDFDIFKTYFLNSTALDFPK